MPVLINSDTGLAEDLDQDSADQALANNTHQVPLNDPQGNPVSAPKSDATNLLQQGYSQPSSGQLSNLLNYAKYNTGPEQAKTFAEGALEGATLGLSTAAERALGVDPEDIRGRREANPGTYTSGQIAGVAASALLAPAKGVAGALGAAGRAIVGSGESVLANAGRIAVESALFQSGDEMSRLISEDPNQSAETAITDIGLSGLLGGVTGGVFGAAPKLWNASTDNKIGSFLSDFAEQVKYRANNLEPVKAITEEIQNRYNQIKGIADEVFGPTGLKAQDIQKVMPDEMNDAIVGQSIDVQRKVQNALADMEQSPSDYPSRLVNRLRKDLVQYTAEVGNASEPGDIFNATQNLKQDLQAYSKFDKFVKPVDEAYDFVQKAKSLSFDLRGMLEDSDVWGKAADRQKAINAAFTDYLPKLQDFEKKFTSEVNGERVIDPAKINTYYNQLGKPNAELKQEMLKNFFDASDKYEKVINETHANLGIESPLKSLPLAMSQKTLNTVTPGARLANSLINKGLSRLGGEALGAGIGGAVGHAAGSTGFGALIGEHMLGPFFNSILPALVKPFLTKEVSPAAAATAADLGISIIKGESMLSKGAKAVFKAGEDVLPGKLIPSDKTRQKIDSKVKDLQSNASDLFNVGGNVGYYMPDHGSALAAAASRGVQYLNSVRPNTTKTSPLDSPLQPSAAANSAYNRTINLVEQPLLALQHIKDGTLTSNDIKTVATVYPSLYARMSQKLFNEMTEHVAKGNDVPYSTRLGLSLFLEQPLDTTMKPESIIATQPTPPMMTAAPVRGKSKGSLQSLKKTGAMYQTSLQASEAEKLTRNA